MVNRLGNKIEMNTILGNPLIDIYVVLYGGVGTTFLINFLSKYLYTNHPADADGFKHIPLPPIRVKPQARFIYIFGDPIVSAISLFRRNFHYQQSKKLQRFNLIQNLINKDENISSYANRGKDKLNIEQHFNNWFQHYRLYRTLFLRYDSIWDNIGHLIDFLELPEYVINDFPKKRERNSLIDSIDAETYDKLKSMYRNFSAQIEALPNVIIREALETKASRFRCYLSSQYIKAYCQFGIAGFKRRLK